MKVLKLNFSQRESDSENGTIGWVATTVVFYNFSGAIMFARNPKIPHTDIDFGAHSAHSGVYRVKETPEEILAQMAEWEKPQPVFLPAGFTGAGAVLPNEEPEFCGHAVPRALWAGEVKPAEAETGEPVG